MIHREISLTKALSVSLPNGYFTSLNETVSNGDKGHKAIRYIGEFFWVIFDLAWADKDESRARFSGFYSAYFVMSLAENRARNCRLGRRIPELGVLDMCRCSA